MSGIGIGLASGPSRAGFDFAAGALPPGAVLTRAGPAGCIGPQRDVVIRAANEARFDHDLSSGRRRGLLIEPAAINLVAQSHLFEAPWGSDHGGAGAALPVVTPGAAIAPDGGSAATIAFMRGSGGYSRMTILAEAVAAGEALMFSIWLKASAPGPSIALRCDVVDSGTLSLKPEWQRYTLRTTSTGAPTACQILLWSDIAGSPLTAEIAAWGAQLETGQAATSLIATSGAPASRAADTLTLDWGSRGVGDGVRTIRTDFEDGASDAAVTVAAGLATVAVPAGGARLVRAEAL